MNDRYLPVASSSSTNSFPVAFKVVGTLLSSLANGVAMSSAERTRRNLLLQEQMRVCVAEYRIKKCGELTRTALDEFDKNIRFLVSLNLPGHLVAEESSRLYESYKKLAVQIDYYATGR